MKFAADPLTLAFAMGLLGPAAVDEHGLFDDGTPHGEATLSAESLASLAVAEQQAEDALTEEFEFSLEHPLTRG